MRIIITMHTMRYLVEFMKEIQRRYSDIISKSYRTSPTIELINGDVIKGYSATSRRDGLSADIAIGIDAEYITCRSKEEEPIWDSEKLFIYLESIRT